MPKDKKETKKEEKIEKLPYGYIWVLPVDWSENSTPKLQQSIKKFVKDYPGLFAIQEKPKETKEEKK